MLLFMACTNVAGIMLLKGAAARETAIRLALGASRVHLIVRTVVESIALGLFGACGGFLVARVCAPFLRSLLPLELAHLPVSLVPDLRIDLFRHS